MNNPTHVVTEVNINFWLVKTPRIDLVFRDVNDITPGRILKSEPLYDRSYGFSALSTICNRIAENGYPKMCVVAAYGDGKSASRNYVNKLACVEIIDAICQSCGYKFENEIDIDEGDIAHFQGWLHRKAKPVTETVKKLSSQKMMVSANKSRRL
jgi:hypothetical protein